MKIRNGFVSNSSSSSFVVVSNNSETKINYIPDDCLTFGEKPAYGKQEVIITFPILRGNLEFGWEFERYSSFFDKCNYVVAQLMGLDKKLMYKYRDMLEKVLKKHIKPELWLTIRYDYNYFHWDSPIEEICYIDHQSAYFEEDESKHYLFRSEENLENFLFNNSSFIQCGNDNEDPTDEWREAAHAKGSEYSFRYLKHEEQERSI